MALEESLVPLVGPKRQHQDGLHRIFQSCRGTLTCIRHMSRLQTGQRSQSLTQRFVHHRLSQQTRVSGLVYKAGWDGVNSRCCSSWTNHSQKDTSAKVLEDQSGNSSQALCSTDLYVDRTDKVASPFYSGNDKIRQGSDQSNGQEVNAVSICEKTVIDSERLLSTGSETSADEVGSLVSVEEEYLPAEPREEKRIIKPVYNLAPLVNKSETLSRLVKLGVDLSVIEKNGEATNMLIRLDFDKDIQPRLFFLHDIGVETSDLAAILTRYPMILQDSLDDLRTYVQYLRSKKFSNDAIARIITKAPSLFSLSVVSLDTQLGNYQRVFSLSGEEVREVITRLPKLLTWNFKKVQDVKFYMVEFLGFSKAEVKQIFMAEPKVLLSDKHQLGKRFDYLYNEMKLSHHALLSWSRVFRTRLHIIKGRHQFLKHLGRDQFNPQKENYVSLKALVSGRDGDFCFHVAKSSVSAFNNFQKTQ